MHWRSQGRLLVTMLLAAYLTLLSYKRLFRGWHFSKDEFAVATDLLGFSAQKTSPSKPMEMATRPLCPLIPPELVGRVDVSMEDVPWEKLNEMHKV